MKDFIVLGNKNAVVCKEVFPLIKENKIWIGNSTVKEFVKPSGEVQKFGNICWYTTHTKRNAPIDLCRKYSNEYHKYDNYEAIEVHRVKDIPYGYEGIMGVPISFLDKYCPEQFEIVGMAAGNSAVNGFGTSAGYKKHINDRGGCGVINGKRVYTRLLIKKK